MEAQIPLRLQVVRERILEENEALKRIMGWRLTSQKIVFTNGCFDILHRGHIEYLAAAASLGNKLIIGLNTDDSVRRQNKGPGRPVNDQGTRAILLAALGFTDLVIPFDEDTPEKLIAAVKPDILVKGADYKPEEIAGYDIVTSYGGEVITIPLTEGFSTSSLIRKIQDGQA